MERDFDAEARWWIVFSFGTGGGIVGAFGPFRSQAKAKAWIAQLGPEDRAAMTGEFGSLSVVAIHSLSTVPAMIDEQKESQRRYRGG